MATKTTQLKAWKALEEHYEKVGKHMSLKQEFAKDSNRFDGLNATFGNIGHSSLPLILLDYSKNLVNQDTMKLLMDLVREAHVETWRDRMLHGDKINST